MELIEFHLAEGGREMPPEHKTRLAVWVTKIIEARGGEVGPINYIFCGDDYLHALNVQYLGHDTLTDIITFPYEQFPIVSGDLFISTERIADNATDLKTTFSEELHRVIIHGVLHLCGQSDKSADDAVEMRRQEDWALALRPEELIE